MLKEVVLKGINGVFKVNEDGTEVYYNDKLMGVHVIEPKKNKGRYFAIYVGNRNIYIHKLVAEAWLHNPKPVSYKIVLHIDGDTENNHYENLQWANHKMLYQNRVKLGIPGVGVTFRDKEYRGSSTISYDEAIKIAQRLDNGEYAKDISKEYGVSEMSIIRIRKRYCKQKVASPRYTKEVKEVVLKLNDKYTYKQIASITGIRYETVLRWCKAADKKKTKD
jgi:uncharacterized protein YerC